MGAIGALAFVVAATGAAPASAAETRVDYVAQTDRICKQANRDLITAFRKFAKANTELLKPGPIAEEPTKKELRREMRTVARVFGKVNRIFGRMVHRISFVPIPTGDQEAVLNWISGMRAYKRMNDRANLALKRGQLGKWIQRLIRGFESLQNGALAVRDFGYRNCPAGDLDGEAQLLSGNARVYAHSSGS